MSWLKQTIFDDGKIVQVKAIPSRFDGYVEVIKKRVKKGWTCCVCGKDNYSDSENCGCGHYICEECQTFGE